MAGAREVIKATLTALFVGGLFLLLIVLLAELIRVVIPV